MKEAELTKAQQDRAEQARQSLDRSLEKEARLAFDPVTPAELDRIFSYHPPSDTADTAFYREMRHRGRMLAQFLVDNLPHCRERSRALTHLEDVVATANAGRARRRRVG